MQKESQRQCGHCPWLVATDTNDIPNGYSESRHEGLAGTIADPSSLSLGGPLRLMACHESPVGKEVPCVGWLHHQLGVGNNISLRLEVWANRLSGKYELAGDQHKCFEDTLPRNRRKKKDVR